MSDTTFVFRLSSYNQSALLTQVSQALEARNVLVSRAKMRLRLNRGKGVFKDRRPGQRNPFDKQAAKLLEGKDKIKVTDDIRISFNNVGMRTARSFIPYTEFYCGFETKDLLLLVYGPLVTLLQKRDLIEGELDELRTLLEKQLPLFTSIEKLKKL